MKTHYKLRFSIIAASVSAALLLSACQQANEKVEVPVTEADAPAMDPHAGHDMSADAMVADGTPITPMLKEYSESMTKMHEEMMVGMDYNDPDAAFAQGMLGHHIGAVDMAEIELKYGTDAEMRKLAQEIIDAQQSEIEQMQNWINANKA